MKAILTLPGGTKEDVNKIGKKESLKTRLAEFFLLQVAHLMSSSV